MSAGRHAGPRYAVVLALWLAAAAAWGQHPPGPSSQDNGATGILVSNSVRFRSAPSTSASILTAANAGTLVTILSRSEKSEDLTGAGRYWWYDVQLAGGRKAWVYGQFVWILKDQDFLGTPARVTLGGERYKLETFTPHGEDTGSGQADVTFALALTPEAGGPAVPVMAEPSKAPHPNPDHFLVITTTFDNGGEGVSAVEATTDHGLRIVVSSVNTHYSRDEDATISEHFDTTYLCTYRTTDKGAVFQVTSVDEGKHTIDKTPGK